MLKDLHTLAEEGGFEPSVHIAITEVQDLLCIDRPLPDPSFFSPFLCHKLVHNFSINYT